MPAANMKKQFLTFSQHMIVRVLILLGLLMFSYCMNVLVILNCIRLLLMMAYTMNMSYLLDPRWRFICAYCLLQQRGSKTHCAFLDASKAFDKVLLMVYFPS